MINDRNTLELSQFKLKTSTNTNRCKHSQNVTNSIDIRSGLGVRWQWRVIHQPPCYLAEVKPINPSGRMPGQYTLQPQKKSPTRDNALSKHRAGWQLNTGCFGPSWATFCAASDNLIYFYTEQLQHLSKPESSARLLPCSVFAQTVCLIWVTETEYTIKLLEGFFFRFLEKFQFWGYRVSAQQWWCASFIDEYALQSIITIQICMFFFLLEISTSRGNFFFVTFWRSLCWYS